MLSIGDVRLNHLHVICDILIVVSLSTAVPKSEISNVPFVDVDAADCNPSCGNTTLHASLGKAENKTVSTNDFCEERPSGHQEHSDFKYSEDEARKNVTENLIASDQFKLNSDPLDSSSEVISLVFTDTHD